MRPGRCFSEASCLSETWVRIRGGNAKMPVGFTRTCFFRDAATPGGQRGADPDPRFSSGGGCAGPVQVWLSQVRRGCLLQSNQSPGILPNVSN